MNADVKAAQARGVSDKVMGIQFLRALAATMVVLSHLFERLAKRDIIDPALMQTIWVFGGYGVHIFFAVSGYVIFYASRNHFQGSTKNALIFLGKRLIRIYPLYFIMTLVYLGFAFLTKHEVSQPIDILKSLLFVPYVNYMGLMMPVYMLGWTLNYEMFFYLVFALALLLPKKQAVLGLVGTFFAFSLFGTFYVWAQGVNPMVELAQFYTNPVLLFFIAGLLSVYLKDTSLEGAVLANNFLNLLISIVFVALGMVFHAHVWASSLCVFIFVRVSTRIDYTRLMPIWLARKIQSVGDASYSLYLTHSFFLGFIVIGIGKFIHMSAIAVPICILLALAVCIPVAGCCYRFIERPLLERGNRWLKSISG
jgi:exopolysaccharide production protein ExoZ